MTFYEFIVQLVPGADIVYHLSKRPQGISEHEYAHFGCMPDECQAAAYPTILRCQKNIADQASRWVADWMGISTPVDLLKAVVGAVVAVALGATWVGLGVGIALTVAGLVDLAIVGKKAKQIGEAAKRAIALYCVCG